jgi:hypothetical protein
MKRDRIIQPNRDAELAAMAALQQLSAEIFKNGVSITKLAANFAGDMGGAKAIGGLLRHIAYEGIGSAECRCIADVFLSQQPPEVQQKRKAVRKSAQRHRLIIDLQYGRENMQDIEWTRESVLNAARKRQAVVDCALAAIEREGDSAGAVLQALAEYLTGGGNICMLERCCEELGYTPQSNVVAFVPAKRPGTNGR